MCVNTRNSAACDNWIPTLLSAWGPYAWVDFSTKDAQGTDYYWHIWIKRRGCHTLNKTIILVTLFASVIVGRVNSFMNKGKCVGFHRFFWSILTEVCRDSSVGIATNYGLDGPGIESRWGREFPVQTGPGAHPAFCTMGTGSFVGVKRPGRDVDHSLPSSTEVKERVKLYLYSLSGPSWPVLGWP